MSVPVYRDCPYDIRYKNLCKGWEYSGLRLERISIELQQQLSCEKTAILVAGSYGRYEAGPPSDLDFFVISMPGAASIDTMNTVSLTAEKLGIKLPNKDGVFSEVIAYDNILNKLGKQDEGTSELAQRLLPLLESSPLYNPELCEKVTVDILNKYMTLHRDAPEKEAVILLNDLIRFFRYICANYQYKSWHDGEKWVMRNIKLRHSRVVMYAGLLFVILNASKDEYRFDKDKYIKQMLSFAPVERIATIMIENNYDPHPFLYLYDNFLGMINDAEKRKQLIGLEYSERHDHSIFGKLKQNAVTLQDILTDFFFNMRGIWFNKAIGYVMLCSVLNH